jgi:RecA-family ATPase
MTAQWMTTMMQDPQQMQQMQQWMSDPEFRQQMFQQMNTMMNDPQLQQQMFQQMDSNPELKEHMEAHVAGNTTKYENLESGE